MTMQALTWFGIAYLCFVWIFVEIAIRAPDCDENQQPIKRKGGRDA